ncbi:hypothetical protein D3C80_1908280 [compost metagenome]
MKKEVFTPSLATSSCLYGGAPKSFSKRSFDVSKSFTAMPMCSIFLIVLKVLSVKALSYYD